MTTATAPNPVKILAENRISQARSLVAQIDFSSLDIGDQERTREFLIWHLSLSGQLPEWTKYYGDNPQGRVVWKNTEKYQHIALPLPPDENLDWDCLERELATALRLQPSPH